MNRPFDRRTQGIVLVVIGVVAVIGGGLLLLSGQRLDASLTYRPPIVIGVGLIAIVVGVLRLRGKITN